MNRVVIDLNALRHNLGQIGKAMDEHGAAWTVVTKSLCGHVDTLKALHFLGTRSVADSRLDNLRTITEAKPEFERWYLRLPHLSAVEQVVELADISLNSEIAIIRAISDAAVKRGVTHRVVIMVELGDLREGILPGSLVKFYEDVFKLPGIEVPGLGAQVGCLAGAVPNVDQVSQLLLYRELLELKFDHHLPMVSAGSTNFLPLLLDGQLPRGVNHFRIGEALFLGSNLVHGGTLPGFRDDVVRLEAEVAEIKEKSLVPTGETGAQTPFEQTAATPAPGQVEEDPLVGQRGYRALVPVGQLDTDVFGLTPFNPQYQVAGASSDITVINVGEGADGLRVGDIIKFKPNYSAFVRLMNDDYIPKVVDPPLEEFKQSLPEQWKTSVPPAVEELADAAPEEA